MQLQRTVRQEIVCTSVGLHTGRKVHMVVKPAGIDAGIAFVRTDLAPPNIIKANMYNVSDTQLATTIGNDAVRVSTVEHLLSAFSGMGVDNAVVELDAPEIPIMDGSAQPFVTMLRNAGTRVQGKGRKLLVIKKPVSVSDGDGTAVLLPFPEFKITYKIDFRHPLISEQSYEFIFSGVSYERDICIARTFGFLKDVEHMQAKGLALGGSLNNAVVLTEDKIVNKEGLRSPDEFVKHKILDAIGDLSLLGMPIIGHFIAYKSGHKLNNLLLRELMDHEKCWKIVGAFNGGPISSVLPSLNQPHLSTLDVAQAC
ncbi:MAG: UDP-3-O-acyl-N-acetylglucosamine deacetylase [Syntrophales bacterium]